MSDLQNNATLQEKHDNMLWIVNSIAQKLLAYNATDSFDEIVTDCLRMLGEALGQNRVYIWKDSINSAGTVCCIQVYEWVKDIHSIKGEESFENLPYEALPTFLGALNEGKCLNQLIRNLTLSEKNVLEPQKILSILVAPIIIDRVRWGFIGVDNCQTAEYFSKYEENMLLTSGFMLASAILKQATETNLRMSEELVQAMFDATPLCCSVWNSNYEVLSCNDSAVKLFGLKNKQVFVENFASLSPEVQPCGRSSLEMTIEYVSNAFHLGRLEFEWLHQKPTGETFPAHVTLVRIKYRNEDAVAAYMRDMSELKAQEEKRRIAEERTQLMLNAMPLCCNFWDINGNNITCNDEAVRLFELNSQQEYLEHFLELSPKRQPCGRLSTEFAQEKIDLAFSGGYARFEWLHQRLDGTPIPAEVTLIRLEFQNEHFVVGYTRDLREYKAMLAEIQTTQQELAFARDEALAHSKAKSDFLANMSHEIRTPMNGIIGLSYLALQFPEIDPQLRDYVVKIDNSAKSLLRIINDILDFSKINAGKLDIEHLPFDLTEILEQTIQPIIPTITEKGLEIFLDFAEGTPTNLVGDAVRLRQVILNLLNNATKFTHSGSIVIGIENVCQTDTETTLRFTVSDTGVGIAPEYLKRLFQAFSQADTSVTRRYGGTGLGLAICKQIISLMGGEVSVKSELGKGSTFVFTAKFGIAQATDLVTKKAHALDGKKVLVVDDSETSCKILEAYLSHLGANVDCVADGRIALDKYEQAIERNDAYFAVMLDWKMPGMCGLEVASGIRDMSAGKAPVVIMVTAYDREITAIDAKNADIDVVLTKPVTPSSLYNALLKTALLKGKVQWEDGSTVGKDISCAEDEVHSLRPLFDKRVLLAEDNEINQLIAVELLSSYGMEVTVVGTGREAVQYALADSYDVILMDIQMPELDGIEATKIIREQHPELNSVPIIAMTAHAMAGDHEKSLLAGMQDHITKPIDPEELYASLCHWLIPENGE